MQRRSIFLALAAVVVGTVLGAGVATATGSGHDRTEKLTEITSLEDLRGLPCGEGTQWPGTVDFRIFAPQQASVVQWACVRPDTQGLPPQSEIEPYPEITNLLDDPRPPLTQLPLN
jgi:hypothetical protein